MLSEATARRIWVAALPDITDRDTDTERQRYSHVERLRCRYRETERERGRKRQRHADRQRQTQVERHSGILFGWSPSVPSTDKAHLCFGSPGTVVSAITLIQMLQVKLSSAPSHSILTHSELIIIIIMSVFLERFSM